MATPTFFFLWIIIRSLPTSGSTWMVNKTWTGTKNYIRMSEFGQNGKVLFRVVSNPPTNIFRPRSMQFTIWNKLHQHIHICKYSSGMGTCACTLCSITCILNGQFENLQFDRVKGHARDPSSNSMLLLTSTIIVQSFIILSRFVPELSWARRDRQTNRQT